MHTEGGLAVRSLQDKASSKNDGSEAKNLLAIVASRWTRFAVTFIMLLGYVFADSAGQALAQDQRELARAQCEEEASRGFNA